MNDFLFYTAVKKRYHELLSKTKSGYAKPLKQAFFMPEKTGVFLSYPISQGKTNLSRLNVRYGWLILQNKAFAKYAERLLFVPRVKPTTFILGAIFLTQKQKERNHER